MGGVPSDPVSFRSEQAVQQYQHALASTMMARKREHSSPSPWATSAARHVVLRRLPCGLNDEEALQPEVTEILLCPLDRRSRGVLKTPNGFFGGQRSRSPCWGGSRFHAITVRVQNYPTKAGATSARVVLEVPGIALVHCCRGGLSTVCVGPHSDSISVRKTGSKPPPSPHRRLRHNHTTTATSLTQPRGLRLTSP
jgi:hypothetical protein